ncbi:MAG: hypothetical protein J6Y62_06880 [Clostridia bacterium]|nr:hypothetical protein [Clostridia bacterium]
MKKKTEEETKAEEARASAQQEETAVETKAEENSAGQGLSALGYEVTDTVCKRLLAERNGRKMFLFARIRDEYRETDDLASAEGATEICVAFYEGGEGPAKTCLAKQYKGRDLNHVLEYEKVLDKQCVYLGMTPEQLYSGRTEELNKRLEEL